MNSIKIGDTVGYINCCDEVLLGKISHIYSGEKNGFCSLFIEGLNQHFDYPINDLITKESLG